MIKKGIIVSFLVSFLLLVLSCKNEINSKQNTELPKAISYDFTPKDTTWKSLTLREKIGQTMIIRAYHDNQVAEFGSIDKMMEKYPVGGIFIPFWDYLFKEPREQVIPNIIKAVGAYENAARFPMLVTEDFERGVGSTYFEYTHMPAEMALGAANQAELARRFGSAIAKESSTLGINWLLHPLTDLNRHPLQNLVIERAISDDATRAYPLLKAQIEGMKEQGVVATIKHFPGDGATIKNQHFVTSANNLSLSDWNASFGTLYQNMINDGVACIMVGHIRFPAYQKEKLKGVYPPATLSKELMVDLLKGKMKFNGVIMSDALNMGGVAGYYDNELETAIEAFKAGVDLVLWPSLEYMDEIEARINNGEIPMSRLDDAVKRIWGVREKNNLLTKKETIFSQLTQDDKNEIQAAGNDLANHAVTLLSDAKEIPLNPEKHKRIIIVNLSHSNKTKELSYTKELLQEKGFEVDTILHNPRFFDWDRRLDYFKQYDKIFVAFENKYFDPLGSAMLKADEAAGLWTMGMMPPEKIIAVSYSNPYYVNFYFENTSIRINAYSIDKFSQKAVVDALTGAIPFKGTSPVKLDHEMLK